MTVCHTQFPHQLDTLYIFCIFFKELSIMRFFGDSGDGIRRKKLSLNLDLLQLKQFFNCIFGFSTLKNPWDALIVQKLAIKIGIPIKCGQILTGKTHRKDFQKVALQTTAKKMILKYSSHLFKHKNNILIFIGTNLLLS